MGKGGKKDVDMHGIHKGRKLYISSEIFVYSMHWCVCSYVRTCFSCVHVRYCVLCVCVTKSVQHGMDETHRCVINIWSAQK